MHSYQGHTRTRSANHDEFVLDLADASSGQTGRDPCQEYHPERACACGQHTSAGSECEECKQKRAGVLQRAAIDSSPMYDVPPIVHELLNSPG